MKNFACLLLFICFTATRCAQHDECPSINIGDDIAEVKKDLTLKVYNSPIDGADDNTNKVIDELRCLAESGNCYQKQIAYTVALWFSAHIDHLSDSSSFCGLAELINASVSKDPDQLRSALESAGVLEKQLSLYRLQNSIEASGCCAPSVIDGIENQCCYENGYAYSIDVLWKRRGNVLPSDFCGIIHDLYESDLVVNKYLALLISYCITPQIEALTEKYPLSLSLQATSLQFSCKIPVACCVQRLDILHTLSEDTAEEAKDILDSLKPPCVCPSLCVSPDDYEESLKNVSVILLNKAPCSLTEAGQKVRDYLEELTCSDSTRYRQLAGLAAILYDVYSVNLHQLPNLCSYSMFINETLVYNANKCKSRIHDAIEEIRKLIPYFFYLLQLTSISSSGCSVIEPIPKVPGPVPECPCYKDGFAYDVRRIWSTHESHEGHVPPGLAKQVIKLYYSKSKLDRLLALCLSFSVADIYHIIFEYFDMKIGFQQLSALVSDRIPKCCCKDRLSELSDLSGRSNIAFDRVLEVAHGAFPIPEDSHGSLPVPEDSHDHDHHH